MPEVLTDSALSESEFVSLIESLAASPFGEAAMCEFLREDHPCYFQKGNSAVTRMRGWTLLTLARTRVSEIALPFILEELETGVEAYLVAAAAFALRSYPVPNPAFVPYVLRAINNIRYRDEPICFDSYGEYADSLEGTSPLHELLLTLRWLGGHAQPSLPEIKLLENGFPRNHRIQLAKTIEVIANAAPVTNSEQEDCCGLPAGISLPFFWKRNLSSDSSPVSSVLFEDHKGASVQFEEYFSGRPTIVVFFYTRCDNPLKCSLTITKLARVQKLLEARGLKDKIQTAAITYDPEFDHPERMSGYGKNRGLQLDDNHRIFRTVEGMEALRKHFKLGVNFVESLVNRHRLELYLVDADGRIATSYERLSWNEEQVVESAIRILEEQKTIRNLPSDQPENAQTKSAKSSAPVLGTIASLGVAFFPKCPVCWAGYMSVFGIAGLEQIPYAPWLLPILMIAMLINLASVWLRSRATGKMNSFYLVVAGMLVIVASKLNESWEDAAIIGILLTTVGSVLSVVSTKKQGRQAMDHQSAT